MADASEAPQPIVVGVDGSPSSMAALRWAEQQAERCGTTVEATISWELPTTYGWSTEWVANVDFEGDAKAALSKCLDAAGLSQNPRIQGCVVRGHAATVLVEASRHASLLVVGTRGHGELAGMLLGSVSSYAATHAHCPVVIVRDHPED